MMIKARIKAENPEANMKSYTQAYQSFSWAEIEKEFTWHQSGEINIVHEAIDRWADHSDTSGSQSGCNNTIGETNPDHHKEN